MPNTWLAPPDPAILNGREVHVWRASLDVPVAQTASLRPMLSADEAARADRFYWPRDRERYTVAHAALRQILGAYAGRDPRQLRFETGPHGKPRLQPDPASDSLSFSLSHSHELALIAVSRDRALGVDIERIRPEVEDLQLAERFFAPEETASLRALPAALQNAAFFALWTGKEAYVKATGQGLSLPLDQFVVSVDLEGPAALLETRGDPAEAARWSLARLEPGPGYAAAIAMQGPAGQLRCWQWTIEYSNGQQ